MKDRPGKNPKALRLFLCRDRRAVYTAAQETLVSYVQHTVSVSKFEGAQPA